MADPCLLLGQKKSSGVSGAFQRSILFRFMLKHTLFKTPRSIKKVDKKVKKAGCEMCHEFDILVIRQHNTQDFSKCQRIPVGIFREYVKWGEKGTGCESSAPRNFLEYGRKVLFLSLPNVLIGNPGLQDEFPLKTCGNDNLLHHLWL